MHLSIKNALLLLLILAVIGVSLDPADGYVLQGPHVLELMAQRLGTVKTLLVSQKLVLYDTSLPKSPVELEETIRYAFPEKFRSDLHSETALRIHVVSSGVMLTIVDGKAVSDTEMNFDLYKDIFLYRPRILLQKRLSFLGVDVSVSSLGRFQDRLAYVVGAEYPDETVSQIWIDKDTFRPFRWLLRPTGGRVDDAFEIRYSKWRQVDKIWYPVRIEFYQNDMLVREIVVDEITMNISFSDDFFNVTHLKSMYPPMDTGDAKPDESEGITEVQRAIEDFKKVFDSVHE
jgi:outer membrane lipoprotein-sorting protein